MTLQLSAVGSELGHTHRRTETVWPGMCGPNSLLVGQFGDWTWDAVSRSCGTDVLRARNEEGEATYLSFCYFRMRGDASIHPLTPTFGDRLDVASRVFAVGQESVLTVHRVGIGDSAVDSSAELTDEQFVTGVPGVLVVENYNRWVARGTADSNAGLRRSAPPTFCTRQLRSAPAHVAPRLPVHESRSRLTFRAPHRHDRALGRRVGFSYRVNASRDINGVGLLYFASYFSIVDEALLALWHDEGRTDTDFLRRIVIDHRMSFLGNVDCGSVIDIAVQRWMVPGWPDRTAVDVVLRSADDERVLAVSTVVVLEDAPR